MDRRIFGIETEFGITFSSKDSRPLSPEEVARYLFRRVVSWGRSSNVFLANGSRLYLDVGSHPEYATAECDEIGQLIAHDRAGELILNELVAEAEKRLNLEGFAGSVYLFKNNTDSAGNSYGSHENYLIGRRGEFARLAEILIPFLVTRQLIAGAGKVHQNAGQANYSFSQRAEHIWEGISSATTRSRPIINTRDEPHADAELYRRLHVIVGDSNMSETTTMLKVGTIDLILRMVEDGVIMRDLRMENPIRSIREISQDLTGMAPVKLANGRVTNALEIQREYFEKVSEYLLTAGAHHALVPRIMDLWQRTLNAIEQQDFSSIETEIDWAIKKKLLDAYQAKNSLTLNSPRLAQIDLAYHDIATDRGLYYLLQKRGAVARVNEDGQAMAAIEAPPATTRAALRGKFVKAAQSAGRDYTVDWVHLKLNDQAHQTVLCKDPFRNTDERVDALIASLGTESDFSD
ncbi:putative proteasome component superfamily [Renibacterium salmoninarum ATCC 33209]|uniref:Pup--protein ligase n=1 Tax=Renibacterium salmoninarum (strain ATCC 33209 / DSM 20767 / JCM 11484 / NBRC 15589 / NCIMB 2235) TaxID=288705 RepID=PAFA_RENSM|nr:Pup--protein ligase [Renibacterium salmoninarum]A9WSH9.1 RecName: Full=Pup--protein ligase; AltName: Full=Proteasome accessory factor A; AltName: Full=Pup-conjugating enzyme [Renibacterium salmoninarum ATCC 33209]ABY23767.1 putative proteasome component superfamily [Renibacterium salmoninarum ATCC 33209]